MRPSMLESVNNNLNNIKGEAQYLDNPMAGDPQQSYNAFEVFNTVEGLDY